MCVVTSTEFVMSTQDVSTLICKKSTLGKKVPLTAGLVSDSLGTVASPNIKSNEEKNSGFIFQR